MWEHFVRERSGHTGSPTRTVFVQDQGSGTRTETRKSFSEEPLYEPERPVLSVLPPGVSPGSPPETLTHEHALSQDPSVGVLTSLPVQRPLPLLDKCLRPVGGPGTEGTDPLPDPRPRPRPRHNHQPDSDMEPPPDTGREETEGN